MILALPAILGAMALAADMAVMYFTWANLQRAADAGVLAGAGSLPANTTQAVAACKSYLDRNGVLSASEIATGPTVQNSGGPVQNDQITVTVKRTVPHLFGQVLGLFNAPIQVTATARVVPSGGEGFGAVPIGLSNATSLSGLENGIPNQHLVGSIAGAPGDFGELVFPATDGAPCKGSNFQDEVQYGWCGSLFKGNSIQLGKGFAGVKNGFDDRIKGLDTSATWKNHPAGDPRDIVIPLMDFSTVGTGSLKITGFVHFWIDSITRAGNSQGQATPLTVNGTLFQGAGTIAIGAPSPGDQTSQFAPVLVQ
jgi:hypothetical protein